MSDFKFPDGFKWGSATSAHQTEGDNYNDWSEWEKSSERISQLKKDDEMKFVFESIRSSYGADKL